MAVTNLVLTSLSANQFQDTANANAAVVVKVSSGTLHVLYVDNTANGAASFAKLYDSSGAVTVGTTVPDWVVKVPAGVIVPVALIGGLAFANGLQVATVTVGGTTGTTSPTSAVVVRIAYS